ncbi:MAG: hypothetical protein NTV87_16170, partial [Ignavibacteriae bacterium]|nr:hypothetical protein [Ignavibacteriota bacterium]
MKLINRHIIHSLSKTFVFACGLTVFLILFDLSVTYAQDFSQYAGTHTGKFEFTTPKSVDVTWSEPGGEQKKIKKNVEPDAKLISEINEVSFTISSAGDITITFHAKIRWGNIKSDSKGTLTGKLNSDLSFDITGNTSYEYTLASMSPVSIQDPRTFKGKIAGNKISGWMGAPEGKDRSTYSIDLSADVKGGDCDCEITVPSDLKPGGSLYVVTKTSGCVKSEVIYYNGKDRQISNWDGKAVKVEVQMTCCNGRAFFKTFQIPAYESNEKIEITSTETSKGGNLPAPPAGQVLFGSAAALAIIKLLETLLAGSGKGPKPVPPVAPKKPPPHNPYLDKDGNPRKDLPPLIPMEPWENAGAKSPKEYEEMLKSQKEYEDTIKQREKEYGDGKTESDKKEVKPDEKKQKKDVDDKKPDRKTDDREAGKEIGKELGKDISDIIKIVKEEGKDIGKDISDTRKEVRDVIDKSKTEKKKIILSPENKKDLREFLNEKQKWLEKNAEREKKYAGD